jgi:hypothetical protein
MLTFAVFCLRAEKLSEAGWSRIARRSRSGVASIAMSRAPSGESNRQAVADRALGTHRARFGRNFGLHGWSQTVSGCWCMPAPPLAVVTEA